MFLAISSLFSGFWFIGARVIGASVSVPHTSELAGGFSVCMVCCMHTYVIPYISMIYLSCDKYTMQLAHARPRNALHSPSSKVFNYCLIPFFLRDVGVQRGDINGC